MLHGTIIFAVHRPGYCLLAADQNTYTLGPLGPTFAGAGPKILLHPYLPLAVATGGLANLARTADGVDIAVNTREIITSLLEALTAEDAADANAFATIAERNVLPLVRRMRHLQTEAGMSPLPLDLVVASGIRSTTTLNHLKLTENLQSAAVPALVLSPHAAEAHYGTMSDPELYGDHIRGARGLATFARTLVSAGIEAERQVQAGALAGGHVDVAVIDHLEARFVM